MPTAIQQLRTAAFFKRTDEALRLLHNPEVASEIDTLVLGQTCLQVAAEQGLTDVVRAILACGANAEKISNSGLTALHYAAQRGQLQCVQVLVKHGVDTSLTNKMNETAYDYAVKYHKKDVADYLAQNSGTQPPAGCTQGYPVPSGGFPQAGSGFPMSGGGGYPMSGGGYPGYPQQGYPAAKSGTAQQGVGYPKQGSLTPDMVHKQNRKKHGLSPNIQRRELHNRSPQPAYFTGGFQDPFGNNSLGGIQSGMTHMGFAEPNPAAAFAETFVSDIFRRTGASSPVPSKAPLDEEAVKMTIRDVEDDIAKLESLLNGHKLPNWAKQQLKNCKQKMTSIIQKE